MSDADDLSAAARAAADFLAQHGALPPDACASVAGLLAPFIRSVPRERTERTDGRGETPSLPQPSTARRPLITETRFQRSYGAAPGPDELAVRRRAAATAGRARAPRVERR